MISDSYSGSGNAKKRSRPVDQEPTNALGALLMGLSDVAGQVGAWEVWNKKCYAVIMILNMLLWYDMLW